LECTDSLIIEAGSWSFPMLQRSDQQLLWRREGSGVQQHIQSEHWYIRCYIYIQKAITLESNNRRTPNLELEVQRHAPAAKKW